MTDIFFQTVITALWCFTGSTSFCFFFFFENISASAVQNIFPRGRLVLFVSLRLNWQGFIYFARTSRKIADEPVH